MMGLNLQRARTVSLYLITQACVWAIYSKVDAQVIAQPSNFSGDLFPAANSPRFLLNGTELPNLPLIELAPLSIYVEVPKNIWVQIDDLSRLIDVNTDNLNDVPDGDFAYVSCDPEAYPGFLNASDVVRGVLNNVASQSTVLIMYSIYSNHCNISNLATASQIATVVTTVNPVTAAMLARLSLDDSSKGMARLLPDLNSFTNASGNFGNSNNGDLLGPSPTTAVAMIILYSITGIITALFIVIIITGAVRAHRHPERYGPRNIIGRSRQSRAKGIARAMLETLPIVKFGDHDDAPAKPADGTPAAEGDIEMNATHTTATDQITSEAKEPAENTKDKSAKTEAVVASGSSESLASATPATVKPYGDGTQDDGSLGCSICTEDFHKGEEVRVLPCNHKFHPDCVDPWLLNVSGTCPLCRIDLQPKKEGEEAEAGGEAAEGSSAAVAIGGVNGELPPPLVMDWQSSQGGSGWGGRRNTMAGLVQRAMVDGTREERLAAIRRLRTERERQRQASVGGVEGEERRTGLTQRLRERFRIRTVRGREGSSAEPSTLAREGGFRF